MIASVSYSQGIIYIPLSCFPFQFCPVPRKSLYLPNRNLKTCKAGGVGFVSSAPSYLRFGQFSAPFRLPKATPKSRESVCKGKWTIPTGFLSAVRHRAHQPPFEVSRGHYSSPK